MRLFPSSSRRSDRATSIALALALALGSTAMVTTGVRAAPVATTLVSVNSSGTDGGSGETTNASISADGSKVAFQSTAGDLGPDDAGADYDVYVRDLGTGATELVSVNMDGTDGGDADSYSFRITPDGSKVIFESDASDLVPNDAGNDRDILVRDLLVGTTTLLTANASGTDGGNGSSSGSVLSPDGTKVIFGSMANDLGPTDPGDDGDVYVADLTSGAITLASVSSEGPDGGNAHSYPLASSANGERVLFTTYGNNFGPADEGNDGDLYLRDLEVGTTTLVSVNASGTDGANASTQHGVMDAGGTKVVFQTEANDFGSADADVDWDIYLRDVTAGTTTLVSANVAGTDGGDANSFVSGFSADGAKVTFESNATDLGPANAGQPDEEAQSGGERKLDVFQRDVVAGTTTLVSVNADGTGGSNGQASGTVTTPDGTGVFFQTTANNLGTDDARFDYDLYFRDLLTGSTSLVSANAAGTDGGNDDSMALGISADGTTLLYMSLADDLGPTDPGNELDIYVAPTPLERAGNVQFGATPSAVDESAGPALVTLIRTNGAAGTVSVDLSTSGGSATGADFTDTDPTVTFAPGQRAATVSVPVVDDGVAEGDETVSLAISNPQNGATLGSRVTSTLTISEPAESAGAVVEPGGTVSTGGDATPSDPVEAAVTSPHAGAVTVMEFSAATVAAFGFELLDFEVRVVAPAASPGAPLRVDLRLDPSIVPAGQDETTLAVFARGALASDCGPGSGAGPDPCVLRGSDPATGDIMLRVRASQAGVYTVGVFAGVGGDVALVSVNGDGTGAADAASFSSGPSFLAGRTISADGSRVVFISDASDLVPNDAGTDRDIFVRDLSTGATMLVSVNAAGTDGVNDFSSEPVISADGTKVAFQSYGDNLVADDTNGTADVFVRDIEAGTTTLVSVNHAGTGVGTGPSGGPALSADGNRIAFSSNADDLHPLDNNNMPDIFLRDVVAGTTTLVSVNASNTNGGNGYTSSGAEISADGTRVAFFSYAGDFGPADAGDDEDLYLRDVAAGTTVLVTVNADGSDGGPAQSGDAEFNLSRDGTKVVFDRWSDNHGPDGDEWYYDVYVRDVDAGVTSRVSFNETAAGNRNEDSGNPELSGDGTKVVFTSEPGGDVPYDDDVSVDRDLYVGDLATGTTELVTVSTDGTSRGNDRTRHFAVNGDGTKIVFATRATNLVPIDSNGTHNDVFLRDTTAGTTAMLSVNAAGTDSAAGNSANVSITPAGTRVVFTSTAGDLGPADSNGLDDVYVWPARLPSPVQFSSPQFGVIEDAGSALVTLTRTGDVHDSASVDLTTANGTATAPGDFTDGDTTATFAPGETIATVAIPVMNDGALEGEETVLLTLSNPGEGTALGTAVTATLTVFDPADDGVTEVADQDGTVTTDEGDDGATPADPVETAVTSPNPGAVTIVENNEPTANPPADYELLGTEVRITAPQATPGDPLRLEFRLDAALVGGIAAADIAVVRNGVVADECPGDTDTVPHDPCVTSRNTEPAPDGDVVIVVLTSAASTWNFAVATDGTEGDFLLSIGGSEKLPAVGGGRISVQNEDVILYDASEDAYQMVFDGSDVGLANAEIDALAVLADGDLVLSFQADEKVPGVGKVDDSDLVRFTGDLGNVTGGVFSVFLDGSDIGLDQADEDVDALEFRDGDLYLSTTGAFSARSGTHQASGDDEDVVVCRQAQTGSQSACGGLDVAFDGSGARLTQSGEDVDAFGLVGAGAVFSTTGSFSVAGTSGSAHDLFACGPFTGCGNATFDTIFDGESRHLDGNITAIEMEVDLPS